MSQMTRAEILAGCLQSLDEINHATSIALDTLRLNSHTTKMIIEELMHGAVEAEESGLHISLFPPDIIEEDEIPQNFYEGDDIEELADQIVKKIRENDGKKGIHEVDIFFDNEKINIDDVMGIVQRKLMEGYNPEESTEKTMEKTHEDIDFNNPLE